MNDLKIPQTACRNIAALFVSILLISCGGGGGGSATPVAAAFTTQPANVVVVAPNTATFNAVATGAPTPILQWQLSADSGVNFTDISGATSASYTTPATVTGDSGKQYRVVATNGTVTNSTAATLTVTPAPVAAAFTTQPASIAVVASNTATFNAVATGIPTPTLQWQMSSDNGVIFTDISGATSISYTTPATVAGDSGKQYRVVATNGTAINSTAATLTVTPGLNDTGQTLCDDSSNVMVACTATNSGDTSTMPRQDANFGRDAKAVATTLSKTGAGAAGFDYTKACFDGSLNCAGAAFNAATPAATDWACTKDNHTNLIWSLQTQTATWLNATTALPDAANAATRCGFATGWRLPTRRELLLIVHNGVFNPSIDTSFFPGTTAGSYWSNDIYTSFSTLAWNVDFDYGFTSAYVKTNVNLVRLVRSGQ